MIFDSTIILEYLEDRWPTPALLPGAPAERARVRMLEEAMDTHFEAINWGLSEIRWFRRAEGELERTLLARAASQTRRWFGWLRRAGVIDVFAPASSAASAPPTTARPVGRPPRSCLNVSSSEPPPRKADRLRHDP